MTLKRINSWLKLKMPRVAPPCVQAQPSEARWGAGTTFFRRQLSAGRYSWPGFGDQLGKAVFQDPRRIGPVPQGNGRDAVASEIRQNLPRRVGDRPLESDLKVRQRDGASGAVAQADSLFHDRPVPGEREGLLQVEPGQAAANGQMVALDRDLSLAQSLVLGVCVRRRRPVDVRPVSHAQAEQPVVERDVNDPVGHPGRESVGAVFHDSGLVAGAGGRGDQADDRNQVGSDENVKHGLVLSIDDDRESLRRPGCRTTTLPHARPAR